MVSFNPSNGSGPAGNLIAAANGNLIGTTYQPPYGTVFEITGSGFVVAPPPTGVSLSPATASLAVAQSLSGLAANAKLATVAQVGGKTGDSFSYTLGGAGASAFSLTSSNNVGTLSAGASGAAGGQNGKLYALTHTTRRRASRPPPRRSMWWLAATAATPFRSRSWSARWEPLRRPSSMGWRVTTPSMAPA